MIGIVLVAHHHLASEFLATLEHLAARQSGIEAVDICPGDDIEARRKELRAAVRQVDSGEGVIILADLLGEIPGNLAMSVADNENVRVMGGLSLPMLLKLTRTRATLSLAQALEPFAMDEAEGLPADVAHELKNPLTSLRSAVETLPRARSEASRDRLLEVIQHDVRRLDRLVSDISDVSRLDAQSLRAGAEPLDMAQFLIALTDAYNTVRRAEGAQVRLSVAEERPHAPLLIRADALRLEQVINNIVDNARSFSAPTAEVRVNLHHRGDDVEVTIDDDGPGIPEQALERIFERFYSDRPGETQANGHSGLGLAISRQIVEAHGGLLWAENRRSGADILGARFVIRLPGLAD